MLAPEPLARAPRRATALVARAAVWEAPALSPRARLRLATAIRQDLWRRLRAMRAAAPVVAVAADGPMVRATAAIAALDGAPLAPDAARALDALLSDAAQLRRWTFWAARARATTAENDAQGDAGCSRRS